MDLALACFLGAIARDLFRVVLLFAVWGTCSVVASLLKVSLCLWCAPVGLLLLVTSLLLPSPPGLIITSDRFILGTYETVRSLGAVTGVEGRAGGIERDEMFTTFNMGVGMVLVISPGNVDKVKELLPAAVVIGEVVEEPGVQIK